MDYAVRRESAYLVVGLSGQPSEADVRAMLREVLKQSRDGVRGALIEARVAESLNVVGTMDLVTGLRAMGFAPDYRIAILLFDGTPRRNAQFAEDVAVNRGIAVRVFDQREPAIAWLQA